MLPGSALTVVQPGKLSQVNPVALCQTLVSLTPVSIQLHVSYFYDLCCLLDLSATLIEGPNDAQIILSQGDMYLSQSCTIGANSIANCVVVAGVSGSTTTDSLTETASPFAIQGGGTLSGVTVPTGAPTSPVPGSNPSSPSPTTPSHNTGSSPSPTSNGNNGNSTNTSNQPSGSGATALSVSSLIVGASAIIAGVILS